MERRSRSQWCSVAVQQPSRTSAPAPAGCQEGMGGTGNKGFPNITLFVKSQNLLKPELSHLNCSWNCMVRMLPVSLASPCGKCCWVGRSDLSSCIYQRWRLTRTADWSVMAMLPCWRYWWAHFGFWVKQALCLCWFFLFVYIGFVNEAVCLCLFILVS